MGARIRWMTVVFGAVPATYLAIPAAIGILFGFYFSPTLEPMAFFMSTIGVLGWIGAVALWAAARAPGPVGRRTAWGLGLGIAGALAYASLWLFDGDLPRRLALWPAFLVVGPIVVAIRHLVEHRRAPAEHAKPIDASTLRGVLEALLVLQLGVGLAVAPIVLRDTEGWGSLSVVIGTFPLALGVLVTSSWAAWRHRELRVLAALVIGMLLAWPWLISLAGRTLGSKEATGWALALLVALPVVVVLVYPRRLVRMAPRWVFARRVLRGLLRVQIASAFAWLALAAWAHPWRPDEISAPAFWAIVVHLVVTALVALVGLAGSYAALFSRDASVSRGRCVAVLGGSLFLLALVAAVSALMWLLFAAAAIG